MIMNLFPRFMHPYVFDSPLLFPNLDSLVCNQDDRGYDIHIADNFA